METTFDKFITNNPEQKALLFWKRWKKRNCPFVNWLKEHLFLLRLYRNSGRMKLLTGSVMALFFP